MNRIVFKMVGLLITAQCGLVNLLLTVAPRYKDGATVNNCLYRLAWRLGMNNMLIKIHGRLFEKIRG